MSERQSAIDDLTQAILAEAELLRVKKDLANLRLKEASAFKQLERIRQDIKDRTCELKQLERTVTKSRKAGIYEQRSGTDTWDSTSPRTGTSKRIQSQTKRKELKRFLAVRKTQFPDLTTVRLSEIKRYFERNVTGTSIGNVTQFFRDVIPEALFVTGTSTRNRAIFIREDF